MPVVIKVRRSSQGQACLQPNVLLLLAQVARLLHGYPDGKEQELWQEARAYGCVASLQVCVHSLELHRHSHRA